MDKPREIDAKVGRIRPLGRETYDRRAATALPSATGGRPSTAAPVAGAEGIETAQQQPTPTSPTPFGDINDLIQNGSLRYARRQTSFLPTVGRLNRSLDEYTVNNEDMVSITASYLEKMAADVPDLLEGFTNANEAAQYYVAEISRSFEPGQAPRMVDLVHQSRPGRIVYQYLRRIEEALYGD